MKVKILTSIVGFDFAYNTNDEITLPAKDAKQYIEAGFAEEVKSNKAETATRKAPENAASKKTPGNKQVK